MVERYKHLKSGGNYEVLGEGRVQTQLPLKDMASVVIYRSELDGALWVRPVTEFFDGRFVQVERLKEPVALRDYKPGDLVNTIAEEAATLMVAENKASSAGVLDFLTQGEMSMAEDDVRITGKVPEIELPKKTPPIQKNNS